jgi:hypothetical protein
MTADVIACQHCDWTVPYGLLVAAETEARAVWHVFETHPDVWQVLHSAGLVGPSPKDPRPKGTVL